VILILTVSLLTNLLLLITFRNVFKKTIKKVIGKNISISNAIGATSFSYYCLNDTVRKIEVENDSQQTKPLVQQLIIQPGTYNIDGKTIKLDNEGLYRVSVPFKKNYQVIVYRNDLNALLSSLAWIVSHGNADNKLSFEDLSQKATNDKLYLTCGFVSPFAKKILDTVGYRSRIVSGITLDKLNNYDDAHVMIEIFHPQMNKWILADIDNNLLFQKKGSDIFLNLLEFKNELLNGTLQLKLIAKDIHTDISGYKTKEGYSYNFHMEFLQSETQLLEWYKRVMDVVIIENYFYDYRDIERIKGIDSTYEYLDVDSFHKRFYN